MYDRCPNPECGKKAHPWHGLGCGQTITPGGWNTMPVPCPCATSFGLDQ